MCQRELKIGVFYLVGQARRIGFKLRAEELLEVRRGRQCVLGIGTAFVNLSVIGGSMVNIRDFDEGQCGWNRDNRGKGNG